MLIMHKLFRILSTAETEFDGFRPFICRDVLSPLSKTLGGTISDAESGTPDSAILVLLLPIVIG